jgi:hypothetical protein
VLWKFCVVCLNERTLFGVIDNTSVGLKHIFTTSGHTMNSFYVANDTVVIFNRAIYTRETGKEEGWILKIVDSGSAGSFDPLFKTETRVRTTRW